MIVTAFDSVPVQGHGPDIGIEWVQVRFPRSESRRIRKKWAKRLSSYELRHVRCEGCGRLKPITLTALTPTQVSTFATRLMWKQGGLVECWCATAREAASA